MTRDRAVITIERQLCTLSNGDISNDLDGPVTWFQGKDIFWSWVSQKRCVLGTKLLQNTDRTYPVYRKVPLSMTLGDLRLGFQGHDIFW